MFIGYCIYSYLNKTVFINWDEIVCARINNIYEKLLKKHTKRNKTETVSRF